MSLKSASLTVKRGTTTLSSGIGSTPTIPTAGPFPPIPSYTSAPLLDGTGDPKFVVPGSVLAPAGTTGQFSASFSATIGYQAKSGGTTTSGNVTFSNSATVDKASNAVRILVVPLGDPTKTFASQFSAAATAAVQNAMTTLGRTFPVPDGVSSSLSTTTGGIRYQINPSVLDVTSVIGTSGKFCGTGSNFNALKAELSQFLQSWNTANPAATADRVLGVVDEGISNGSSSGCAEGMASMNSPEAWIRAISSTTPSDSGALASMELAHTFGLVLDARDDPFSPGHSPFVQADGTAANRGYNVSLRSFLSDDHTVMTLSGTWNNDDTIFEKADYEYLHCQLGGTANSECLSSGTVGTSTGVAAGPVFVMSGTTDGTAAGTDVLESYFSTNIARTTPNSASQYRLVQKNGATVLRNDGVPVNFSDTNHGGPSDGDLGLFSIAFPFDTSATKIQLWKGPPDASGSILLYERNKDDPPVIQTGPVILTPNVIAAGPSLRGVPSVAAALSSRVVSSKLATPVRAMLLAELDPTFTVNDPGDAGDSNVGDGLCADLGGNCTLRAAIQEVDANAGTYTINFNLPGPTFTIQPGSPLPAIAHPTTIDGTSQGIFSSGTVVELDGTNAGSTPSATGLTLAASNSVVKGLVINRFDGNAQIQINSPGLDTISGNYIGTNTTGNGAFTSLGGAGIVINNAPNNTIGVVSGPIVDERNVISGNLGAGIVISGASSTGNFVRGNYIGLGADGSTALGNAGDGVVIVGANNVVGGGNAFAQNVISSNGQFGVLLSNTTATGNSVVGNLIGTDASGSLSRGNHTGVGVQVGASDNTIGDSLIANNGNTIAHSTTGEGVLVTGGTGNRILGNSLFDNNTLGIDVNPSGVTPNDLHDPDTGPNNLQNFPVLTSVSTTSVSGKLRSDANTTYRIEFFSNAACDPSGNGEGETFLGVVGATTDTAGDATFTRSLTVPVGSFVTATASDVDTDNTSNVHSTSEFSKCLQEGANPASAADLDVTQVESQDPVPLGDSLTYTVKVTNHGPDPANDVVLLDTLPAGTTFVSATPTPSSSGESCSQSSGQVVCDLGQIDNGDAFKSADVVVTAPTTEGTITNIAKAASNEADPVAANDSSSEDTTVGVAIGGGPFIVNSIGDGNDTDPGDGFCVTTAESCTLRAAIEEANAFPGADEIQFEIGEGGSHTISPASALPAITDAVAIDATTQPGYDGFQLITLDGTNAGEDSDGLAVGPDGGGSSITGFIIGNFQGNGVVLGETSGGAVVQNNLVGSDGFETNLPNGKDGIHISSSDNTTGGIIGSEPNLIESNAGAGVEVESGTHNVIRGNVIRGNARLGIDLNPNGVTANDPLDADIGANELQNFPALTNVSNDSIEGPTTVEGHLSSTSDTTFDLDFYRVGTCDNSGHGEGNFYLGSAQVTTGEDGVGSFSETFDGTLGETESVTATATDLQGNTSEFSACRGLTPPTNASTSVTVADDHPQNVRVDFRAVCTGVTYILDVAEPLDESGTATESSNTGPMCDDPQIVAFATDGFQTDTKPTGDTVQNPPSPDAVASIYSPGANDNDTFLQFQSIPLNGGGNAPGDTFKWFRGTDTAPIAAVPRFDVQPPSGGWTGGTSTEFRLEVTAPNGSTDDATVTVDFLADADNDGIPASQDKTGCAGGSSGDNDPTNSYADYDADGVPNQVEYTRGTDPCVAETKYEAITDFNPDTLNIPSTGQNVTVGVMVPYRNITDVLGSTVRITKLAGRSVLFNNTSWTIDKSGKGIAKFDRQAIISFLVANDIRKQRIAVVVEGASKTGTWTFKGEDSCFVT